MMNPPNTIRFFKNKLEWLYRSGVPKLCRNRIIGLFRSQYKTHVIRTFVSKQKLCALVLGEYHQTRTPRTEAGSFHENILRHHKNNWSNTSDRNAKNREEPSRKTSS